MASNDSGPRVGRSQGAGIFWGLVSVFFAAAACFYFWKSHENESMANKLRDEVLSLQDDRDALNAEKNKLQSTMSDAAAQLKSRSEFLDEKEAKLAAQETKIESTNPKPPPPAPPVSTATVPKKFSDALHKLSLTDGADLTTHGGRPVLRLPNSSLFAPGEATLKPEGQALLNQIALSLTGQADYFELRFECFTDSDAEALKPSGDNPPAKPKKDADAKHFATGWDLTAARAAAIERYFRDQTTLPFENVLIVARGDSQPIATSGKDRLRNRRVEISLAPIPAAFHSTDSPAPDASANKAK